MESARSVLLVPREEVERLLAAQARKDVKVVVPAMLTVAEAALLASQGREVKPEVALAGVRWTATPEAIPVCEAGSLLPTGSTAAGPLAVSFALPGARQRLHAHDAHWEMYYGTERMRLWYRMPGGELVEDELRQGGLAMFGPGVEHRVEPDGLLLVVEVPAITYRTAPTKDTLIP
jgi:hypothetical protein